MRKIITLLFLLLLTITGFTQELPEAYRAYTEKFPEGPPLNHWDSIYLMNIPEKVMPEYLRGDQLPPLVDNSHTPYLRPVFMQEGPSCGQAAMIGYNFTYEMAYKRDQPAIFPQTQYPTHFTWNFQNGGDGWYGVSYFHSLEILRLCGNMNVADYGGSFYDDGLRWINGYDLYYNGMFNRIRGFYTIHTGTTEGILALKHWLYDHMGEGNAGGVASYYANTPWNANYLNDTTPEGGKFVMTAWYPYASHAMTIVGYNDSIRWDYNYDGQYTNDIDLNDDGVIDPRDWEIGAVKFVNSHGPGAQDSGFCYMMYKCLAESFENGGVWNQSVNILDIDENYQPLVTFKVTLKHDRREKVKVYAGVSQDTTDMSPAWMMDFPIFDYQGGNHYLQGHDTTEALKSLEFGLDVTPLLSHILPGEPAKFFFVVDENDPVNENSGEISSFSVMDYTSGAEEFESSLTPVALVNNSRTYASVVYSPDFDIVEITTDTLPPYSLNVPYSYQLQASGGSTPYSWDAQYQYRLGQSTESFPGTDAIQVLSDEAGDTIVPVALGFSFPFYGHVYDTLYMHIDGYLQFDHSQFPWPYLREPELLFRSNRMIVPMTNSDFTITPADGDGGWFEADDTSAVFRWKLSWKAHPATTELNFAVKLCQSGNISFFYGPSTLEGSPWISGISAGNKTEYIDCPLSGIAQVAPDTKVSFQYNSFPLQLSFSGTGLLTGTLNSDDYIYDLPFRVTDQSGLSATKTLQFTSGPYLYYTFNGDDRIEYGDTVVLDLELRNNSQETLLNASVELATGDPFINLLDDVCIPGTIMPGQAITIPEAFSFAVSSEIPDQSAILLYSTLVTTGKEWHKDLTFTANAPDLNIKQTSIDSDDGRIYPGETAPMMVTLQNSGHSSIAGVSAELLSLDEGIHVLDNPVQEYGTIGKGGAVTRSYTIQADDTAPNGMIARFLLNTETLPGLQRQDTIKLKIGMTPVLIVDMDPNNHSGPVIQSQLNELGVPNEYEYSLPPSLDNYQSLFVCLGYHFSNHVLTLFEGQKLAEYLDNGGNLYMEGRKTWKEDPGTPIQPKFSFHFAGTVTMYDTVTGVDGTFTQGFSFHNEAVNPFSFYYLVPDSTAFSILQDDQLSASCAVAFDAGEYRTIGTLFEYGTLAGIAPTTTRELMLTYLNFFGIYVDLSAVEENPVDQGGLVLYPNPASRQLTVDSRRSAVGCRQSAVGGEQSAVGSQRSAVGGRQSAVGGRRSAVTIEITDCYGRRLKEFFNITSFPYRADISGLPDGLYILRMMTDKGESFSGKFLKISN